MFKVFITTEPHLDLTYISFISEVNGKRSIAKPIKLEFEEIKEGESIEHTLKIHNNFSKPFLKAMAEALDKQGIKTENDHKLQGILEATKYHLEDMRKLTFKSKENPND